MFTVAGRGLVTDLRGLTDPLVADTLVRVGIDYGDGALEGDSLSGVLDPAAHDGGRRERQRIEIQHSSNTLQA